MAAANHRPHYAPPKFGDGLHPALQDTLKQMSGTAEPTHALRLVVSRNVEDPETEGNARGVGRTGLGNKSVARRSAKSYGILDPPSHHTASA